MENLKSFKELNERIEESPDSREQHRIDRANQRNNGLGLGLKPRPDGSQHNTNPSNDGNNKTDMKPLTNTFIEKVKETNGDLDKLQILLDNADKEDIIEIYKTILQEYSEYEVTANVISDKDSDENVKILALAKAVQQSQK